MGSLMEMLASKDGMIRQVGRDKLVNVGKLAVPFLNDSLKKSKSDQVRWEAAKALGVIGDVRSIRPLVEALEDDDPDVAWLAAEALIEFKMKAWPLLLRTLIKRGADSVSLRRGAHHVLRDQKEKGLDVLLTELRKVLEATSLAESSKVAANDVLKHMTAKA